MNDPAYCYVVYLVSTRLREYLKDGDWVDSSGPNVDDCPTKFATLADALLAATHSASRLCTGQTLEVRRILEEG